MVFLGDGEFGGTELQAELTDFGWKYACRTSSNTILYDGEEYSLQDLLLQPGMCLKPARCYVYQAAVWSSVGNRLVAHRL